MSIDIEVGVTTSPNHKVDKDFTSVMSVSGVLIHPCTIDAPIIKIAGGYINANFIKGLFNRNYYIESQTLDKGFNYLHCISDPVSSFPQYGSTQYVKRSETHGNTMLNDIIATEVKPQCSILTASDPVFGNSLGTDACYLIGIM